MNKSVTTSIFVACAILAAAYFSKTNDQPPSSRDDVIFVKETASSDAVDLHSIQIPDFASITDVRAKKQAFFSYFKPIITAENDRILRLRDEIQAGLSEERMQTLCERYRIDECTEQQLLYKIDIIPTSMVLAQAAMESAWGTSRFAQQANNYFGQWCFSEGCGIVPKRRSEGAYHEVQMFDSPREAVRAYFLNINSHPAYEPAREIRASAYENDHLVKGSEMVGGLLSYSGIGEQYIEELRSVIRVNRLEQPREVAQSSGGH